MRPWITIFLSAIVCVVDVDEIGYVFTDCVDVALPPIVVHDDEWGDVSTYLSQ